MLYILYLTNRISLKEAKMSVLIFNHRNVYLLIVLISLDTFIFNIRIQSIGWQEFKTHVVAHYIHYRGNIFLGPKRSSRKIWSWNKLLKEMPIWSIALIYVLVYLRKVCLNTLLCLYSTFSLGAKGYTWGTLLAGFSQ